MKRFVLIMLFAGIASYTFGQENPDVYFDKSYRKNKQRTINLPNTEVTQERWYFGIDGAFKIASSTLESNPYRLIAINSSNNDAIWSCQLGYSSNNKWAIELGYAPIPIGATFQIPGARSGVTLSPVITLQAIPIRFKKNILTLDKQTKTASIWVGGGFLISTNSRNEKIQSYYQQYISNVKRGTDGVIISADYLDLNVNSFITNKSLVQLEGSVELQGKIADGFYIDLFFRGIFGQNGGIRTDFDYVLNSQTQDHTSFYTNGFQYSFGLGFRFDYGKNVKYKSRLED
jgi:hypothetical protein